MKLEHFKKYVLPNLIEGCKSPKQIEQKIAAFVNDTPVTDADGEPVDIQEIVLLTAAEDEGADEQVDETEENAVSQESIQLSIRRELDKALKAHNKMPIITGGEARNDDKKMFGFKSWGEYAIKVREACAPGGTIDKRLASLMKAPSNYHSEGVGADGGFAVPPQIREEIWDLVFEEEGILGQTDLDPTERNSVELNADETTPWGSSGIQAKWRAEASQMTATKLALEGRQVRLHELYAFVQATDELIEDAPRLENHLMKKAPQAIRWKADDAVIYGTGAGQPLGYFTSGALVSVAKETSQAADTINATNVAKIFSRQLNPGRSVWLINSDCLPQIMTMTISNQPIWTPPNAGFAAAPGGFLLGRPIILSEHSKTLGDKGDIQFVDLMGYYSTTKTAGLKFDSSIHLFFDYGVTAFRWTFRLGGQPYLGAAVSPANGSNSKSHFVVLDERA